MIEKNLLECYYYGLIMVGESPPENSPAETPDECEQICLKDDGKKDNCTAWSFNLAKKLCSIIKSEISLHAV